MQLQQMARISIRKDEGKEKAGQRKEGRRPAKNWASRPMLLLQLLAAVVGSRREDAASALSLAIIREVLKELNQRIGGSR